MKSILRFSLLVFSIVMIAPSSHAVLVFSEPGGSGTLSSNNMAPTDLGAFTNASNQVRGTVQSARTIGNIDVFTLLIPMDFQLDEIRVSEYIVQNDLSVGGVSFTDTSFVGINAGNTFPYDPFGLDNVNNFIAGFPLDFLGATTFGRSQVDPNPMVSNILPTAANIATSFGQGGGFQPSSDPLGPGQYTIYVQQLGARTTEYELDFRVSSTATAVPEPSSIAFLIGACGIVGCRRRRR